MYYRDQDVIYEAVLLRTISPMESVLPYYVCHPGDPVPYGYVFFKRIYRYSLDGFAYLTSDPPLTGGEIFDVYAPSELEVDKESFESWMERFERSLNDALYEYVIKRYSPVNGVWIAVEEYHSNDIPDGIPVDMQKVEILLSRV